MGKDGALRCSIIIYIVMSINVVNTALLDLCPNSLRIPKQIIRIHNLLYSQ